MISPESTSDPPMRCRDVTDAENNSDLRWTVSTMEDLDAVRALSEAMRLSERSVGCREILAFVRAHPELARADAGETWDPSRARGA